MPALDISIKTFTAASLVQPSGLIGQHKYYIAALETVAKCLFQL
jgi:hypothetical protein